MGILASLNFVRLSSRVDIPLQNDSSNLPSNFKYFVRILVDVDLYGALPKTLVFERDDMYFYISVVYEMFIAFCSVCNNIGHVDVDCRSLDRGLKQLAK